MFFVHAVTDAGKGYFGISAFMVERDTPGLEIGKQQEKIGLRTSPFGDIFFDDCKVPAENMLGAEGFGASVFTMSMRSIPSSLSMKVYLNPRSNPRHGRKAKVARPSRGLAHLHFGGANAHLILEAAQTRPRIKNESREVLVLSARSPEALRNNARQLVDKINSSVDIPLADLCFTMNTGRALMQYRASFVADLIATAREKLQALAQGEKPRAVYLGDSREQDHKNVFMFAGQGSQYPGMGAQLYDSSAIFRNELNRCAEILKPLIDVPLLDLLFSKEDKSKERLAQTQYTQAALVALEWALAQHWIGIGIKPQAVIGRSGMTSPKPISTEPKVSLLRRAMPVR